jgi:hypothetical protein
MSWTRCRAWPAFATSPRRADREGLGFWQAVIPESAGETVITRYTLRELFDKLTAS